MESSKFGTGICRTSDNDQDNIINEVTGLDVIHETQKPSKK